MWSRPFLEHIIKTVKARHPETPVTLYANGSGGLLERMGSTGADVIGLDWTVDMADARRRLGADQSVQVLFCSESWEFNESATKLKHSASTAGARATARPGSVRAGALLLCAT